MSPFLSPCDDVVIISPLVLHSSILLSIVVTIFVIFYVMLNTIIWIAEPTNTRTDTNVIQ